MVDDELVAEDPNGWQVFRHSEPDWMNRTDVDIAVYDLIKPNFGQVGRIEVISAQGTEEVGSVRALAPRILDQMHINPDIRGAGVGKWFVVNVVNQEIKDGSTIRTSFFRTDEANRMWDAIVRDNPQIRLFIITGETVTDDLAEEIEPSRENLETYRQNSTHIIEESLKFVPTERHRYKFMAFAKRVRSGRGWWGERKRHSDAARRKYARR